ncbi:TPA: hypothetical protein DIU27_04650 [Candidatus Collierbacteria bacterium]|uniref:C2H2-type domain-containing protein n=1 Tax=Candidatus Collierbacteria bacterium GW2011_GWB2_44_22 TaxID=1618387 RepID=A0A0G1KV30_9BACT|nr:MAG: hypothetical protein UW31_C0011G0006 [Candidatus Collierbacteria bacterium GW2011_GWA2_44_13]KKT51754.1 MAG: hypothetical protein UW44_C0008G0076 [Candidatus Collierbacteria bacterium GW2011_GWB2_44_22]KKT63656.1 MAG: hypothetical protein UW58_C0054G0006 [Candidatus Collierbacteria bacterium GW2011_GWC2_44_30]KKT68290.1 MAG: hypothetical protein UW64_C0023G0006 [Microgenomates group bacterium GW2011_GWC1_44_37]KKT88233.1 MAG: hypothetical protein UW88_C0013G0002 [Candidatus Collierbacte
MPREILNSYDTSKILSQEKLRYIDAVTEMGHSEIVYEITCSGESSLRCDFCGKGAKFIQHTRDHMGQNFVALTCANCAPSGYEKLSQQRGGG